jgi:hypothetical protein
VLPNAGGHVRIVIMVNYFLSLSVSQALGVCIFGMILIGSAAVLFTDWCVRQVVQHRIAGVDEFAYVDDMWAIVAPAVVPRTSKYNGEVIPMTDDEFRMIDLKSFTCTKCAQSHLCAYAFDLFNTEGACLDVVRV